MINVKPLLALCLALALTACGKPPAKTENKAPPPAPVATTTERQITAEEGLIAILRVENTADKACYGGYNLRGAIWFVHFPKRTNPDGTPNIWEGWYFTQVYGFAFLEINKTWYTFNYDGVNFASSAPDVNGLVCKTQADVGVR